MTVTVLEIIQSAAKELGLTVPTTVVGSTDDLTQQLQALLEREGKACRDDVIWPEMSREYLITIVDGQDSYALPGDFNRTLFRTMWDRSNHWELLGPISAQEWQFYKSGIVSSVPQRRFRVKGITEQQFYVHPVPPASDAGQTLVFEYQSATWLLPVVWTASATFAANSYCSYNGNIYTNTIGGTTGTTPPTHTSGTVSDGGIDWTYGSQLYDTIRADTDIIIIDETVMCLGLQWRYLRSKKFDYASYLDEYNKEKQKAANAFISAPTLSLRRRVSPIFIGPWSVPDSGFGN